MPGNPSTHLFHIPSHCSQFWADSAHSLTVCSAVLSVKMGAAASTGGLSQDDLEFLQRNTHYDKDTICDFYKGFMADCPGGKLNPDSFCQIYSKCFPTGNAKEFCGHVFRTFDTDKNGVIDFKEFLLSIDVTSSGTTEEKLNWAFRYIFLIISVYVFEFKRKVVKVIQSSVPIMFLCAACMMLMGTGG